MTMKTLPFIFIETPTQHTVSDSVISQELHITRYMEEEYLIPLPRYPNYRVTMEGAPPEGSHCVVAVYRYMGFRVERKRLTGARHVYKFMGVDIK